MMAALNGDEQDRMASIRERQRYLAEHPLGQFEEAVTRAEGWRHSDAYTARVVENIHKASTQADEHRAELLGMFDELDRLREFVADVARLADINRPTIAEDPIGAGVGAALRALGGQAAAVLDGDPPRPPLRLFVERLADAAGDFGSICPEMDDRTIERATIGEAARRCLDGDDTWADML